MLQHRQIELSAQDRCQFQQANVFWRNPAEAAFYDTLYATRDDVGRQRDRIDLVQLARLLSQCPHDLDQEEDVAFGLSLQEIAYLGLSPGRAEHRFTQFADFLGGKTAKLQYVRAGQIFE